MNSSTILTACDTGTALGTIVVVASDAHHRARIAREVGKLTYAVPVEDVEELARYWPNEAAVILVYDEGDALQQVIALMEERGDWLPVVCIQDGISAERIVDAVRAGAIDYWRMPIEIASVNARLSLVLESAREDLARRKARVRAQHRLAVLSPRENEVIRGMTFGHSNKEIARALGISPRTVEIHRANVLSRLSAGSSAEAVRLLVESELD